MAGLELALPALRAGLRFWTFSAFGEARQALQESTLHMGRRDKRTWRGKVSTRAGWITFRFLSAKRFLLEFQPGYGDVCPIAHCSLSV